MDMKIIRVALNGLENILKIGDLDSKLSGETNKYALIVEESYGECFSASPSSCGRTTVLMRILVGSRKFISFIFSV